MLITCLQSISSEPKRDEFEPKRDDQIVARSDPEDRVIARFDQHEESVYCVEWSAADPWTLASLSYDGRLLINRVPKAEKYKILALD